MRLFIGTFVQSTEVITKFNQFRNLTHNFFSGKWVEDENLHFTFHFLGDIADEKVPELQEQLNQYLIEYQEKLIIKSIEGFPNINNPRLIVGKIFSPSKEIYKLHSTFGRILKNNNIEFDKRNYRPHLSLIRIKSLSENFSDNLESFRYYDFGEIQNYTVKLIQSTLTPKGPIYKSL